MNGGDLQDEKTLIDFWNQAFAMSEEEKEQASKEGAGDWKELAPSEKLFRAAALLGEKKKVLDYGCGSGWASVVAAKSGCADVTAVDPAPHAAEAAAFTAKLCGVEESVHVLAVGKNWLGSVADETYDGFICSNVLDVVPPKTAEVIIREMSRVVTRDAEIVIGLNYYLSPEAASKRGMELKDGRLLYVDGVLRLVSFTDGEWETMFSPYFDVKSLEHFAWPGEALETRRLFRLAKKA